MIDLIKSIASAAETASTLQEFTKVKLPGGIEAESDNPNVEMALGAAAVIAAVSVAAVAVNKSNKN
ncbi:hypothetical protein [Vibrio metschnikovii]|uniref:hypothetical protein n=1 Tax=Vibrio metschnikovii TaxID=28172 RepID=UPI002FCC500F